MQCRCHSPSPQDDGRGPCSPGHAPPFSLRRSARASDFLFDFAPTEGSVFVSLPQKGGARLHSQEGAERRLAQRVRALARSTGPILPDRPRLTALHCGVLSPWGPASLGPTSRLRRRVGKGQGTSPGRHNAPGGLSKDSRDHDQRNRGRRRRSPSTPSFACRAPLGGWG